MKDIDKNNQSRRIQIKQSMCNDSDRDNIIGMLQIKNI